MKDAYERRALLLHLADVLEAVNLLVKYDDRHRTVRELVATNKLLARLPLLECVSARMTSLEFVRGATGALLEWPRELLEPELNRERLAATVQSHLFAGNPDGWRAYVRSLTGEVSWFGAGVPLPEADEDMREPSNESDADPRALAQDVAAGAAPLADEQSDKGRESIETSQRIYPTWPWKP
ncbi:hypothetical protein LJ656_07350 [Paraburkholderia sp. MMS20-SJTR3]|uniref:Uncharacterized protein n=1 Tax=Paraburkholderia sejongensis TaxID=2886946 RepID=A0ABS8JR75_9BURK|nr:hypothetical protein [Paraburkholderia sp. MMS20-SJTR3]MCC8392401.1 hypothetical protein [Paraburkholderia sp. MMS20-SJTR3]